MNDRPVGVLILSVLHLVGGVLALGVQMLLLANLDHLAEGLETVGIPPALFVIGALFIVGVLLVSGVGMWLGTRWGWWCGAFYYVYSVARAVNTLWIVPNSAEELEGISRGLAYYYARYGGRAIIHSLILLYFFKSNVLEYFGLQDMHKGKALGALIAVTSALFGIATAITWLSR